MPANGQRRRPSARTPEQRENQMILLAMDLAEKQLAEGTASAMVITHYLKLASSRERLEQENLRVRNDLDRARVDQIESTARVEELYENALAAMRSYRVEDGTDQND